MDTSSSDKPAGLSAPIDCEGDHLASPVSRHQSSKVELSTQSLAEQAIQAMQSDTATEFSPCEASAHITEKQQSAQCHNDSRQAAALSATEVLSMTPLLTSMPPPLFGDLVVVLHPSDSAYNYRVDRDRLTRLSVKLSDVLDEAATTFAGSSSTSLPFGLILEEATAGETPQLAVRAMSDICSVCAAQDRRDETHGSHPRVKEEVKPEHDLIGRHPTVRTQVEYAEAYGEMLRILHGPSHAFGSSKSLTVTLDKVETIIEVSDIYDVLPLARGHLREMLHDHGSNAVLIAIKHDPPRWMQLSIQLQHYQWFKEAVVHVIGAYKCAMPGWSAYDEAQLPRKLAQFIKTSADTLQRKGEKLLMDLLLSALSDAEGNRVTYEKDYESWIAVQSWQSWLAGELRKVRVPTEGEYSILPNKVGTLLRNIQKGGNACFDIKEEVSKLRQLDPSHRWLDYADDMRAIMVYASRTVMYSGLTRSSLELQLDGKIMPLEGEHMVGYLVCAEVSKSDVPWS